MRIPRKYLIPIGTIFHWMFRCINGEFLLEDDEAKARYLDTWFRLKKRAAGKVEVYAFCVMTNHGHQAARLLSRFIWWSRWVRSAHSSFALWLNKKLGRRGPIAQDRPKTVAVDSQESLKRLMFYIDWNPVRAGMVSHPRDYPFSSYRYYAEGEVNRWTRELTEPQWYKDLGDTPQERQEQYRKLCDEYYYGENCQTKKRPKPVTPWGQRASWG